LGWDVRNAANLAEFEREVITEDRIRVGRDLTAPDYMFRLGARRCIVVEAKKPSLHLKEAVVPALQVRRYGWNAKDIGIGILTSFDELARAV
jgi:adenine-specific DNA-methyltransferase